MADQTFTDVQPIDQTKPVQQSFTDVQPLSTTSAKPSPERQALMTPDPNTLPKAARSSYEMRPVLPSGERPGAMQAQGPTKSTDKPAYFPGLAPGVHQEGKPSVSGLWDVYNAPVLPAGKMETTGNEYYEKHRTSDPYKAAVAKTVADAGKTTRQFLTSPLAVTTLGAGPALETAGGAVKAGAKLLPMAFGARGAQETYQGAKDIAQHGVTPENVQQTLEGAGQVFFGGAGTAEGTEFGNKPATEVMTAPVRAAGKTYNVITQEVPGAAGYLVGGYPGSVAARGVKGLIPEAGEGITEFGKTQESTNLSKQESNLKKAQQAHAKAKAELDSYAASEAQAPGSTPEKTVKAEEKARQAMEDAQFHRDAAKEALDKSRAPKPTPKDQTIQADPYAGIQGDIDRMAPKVRPAMPEPAPVPENPVRRTPGQVQPETFPQEPTAAPQPATGPVEGPGFRMGATKALPEAPLTFPQEILPPEKPEPAPAHNPQQHGAPTVEAGFAPVPPAEPKAATPSARTVANKVGEQVAKAVGAEPTPARNEPIAKKPQQTTNIAEPALISPEDLGHEVPKSPRQAVYTGRPEAPEEKLSSDPRKAVLQQAKATPEEISKILSRGSKVDPTSKVGLSKLAEHFGVDLGDKAIGRGKEDAAAGTHMAPAEVLKKILDAGHSPADIAKAVDEGKHLPTASGGAPDKAESIAQHADEYNKEEGLPKIKPEKVEKDARAAEIADDFQKMEHDPNDPYVKASYKALVDDIKKQWDYATKKMGIKIEPTDTDPYKSYEEMKDDVKNNKTMKVWRGGNELPADHPLAEVDPKTGESYNTMLRAVHDIFGHVAQGHDFSEPGEESAWNVHKQMMSPEAVPAMTTETRGQTSWFFNHEGVRGGEPLGKFADQKAGLLPEYANERTPDGGKVLGHIKSGGDYGVLTAENPNNERLSPQENAKRNRALAADLREAGYEPVPVEGSNKDVEGRSEHSFYVEGISPKEAADLGRKHGQESVLTTEGLHHLDTDMLQPSDNKNLLTGEAAKQQDYSTKVGDQTFSVPLGDEQKYIGTERRSTERKAPMNAAELDDAMKNRKPIQTPFDVTKGSMDTINKDLESKGLGNPAAPETAKTTEAAKHNYEYKASGQDNEYHEVTARDDKGLVKAIVQARAEDGDPNTWTVKTSVTTDPGKGIGERAYIRLAQAAEDTANRTGKTITLQGDTQQTPSAKATWQKLNDQRGYEVKWTEGRPSITFEPESKPESVGAAKAGFAKDSGKVLTQPLGNVSGSDISVAKYLTADEEAAFRTDAGRKAFAENMAKAPPLQEWIDAAKGGEGARKWYQRSGAAFDYLIEVAPHLFQEGDREKFGNFVAALSPRQMVHNNLAEALHAWSNWVADGRPEGKAMEKSLRDSITSAPNTKVPNAMKALRGEEMWPDLSKNRNFKVPSFGKNLNGYLNFATNDGWQALFGGLNEKQVTNPSSYHPLSVMTRAAADALGWEPAEAQSAIWSFTQALKEKGVVDPHYIREYSEDFADIMAHNETIRGQLKDLGVDLDKLDSKLSTIEEKPPVTPGASRTTEHSARQLENRIEAARGRGAVPEPKLQQNLFYKERPAGEARAKVKDEGIEFDPDKFRTKTR